MKRLWLIPAALLTVGWIEMQPLVESVELPVVDGKVQEAEYGAWARGINFGFGDRIGRRSKIYLRSAKDGALYVGIKSINGFPDNVVDGAVMYIDSAPGGIKSTEELADYLSVERGLVSGIGSKNGTRAVLRFAPDFAPDYALFIKYKIAGIFRLTPEKLYDIAASSANATTGNLYYAQTDGSNLEVRVTLSDIGLTPASPVKFVMTLLNGEDAYRSDELVGVKGLPGGNPAQKTVVLNAGDFMVYTPPAAAPEGDDIDLGKE